jgi:pilus assembly protein CpaB
MKPKTIILMVVAVGCGLAASYMISRLLAERNIVQEEQQEKVKVLVAKTNLEMGLLIKEPKKCFKEKTYIRGEEPTHALTDQDYDKLQDRRLIKPLSTDQFVSQEDLLDKDKNSLGYRLKDGMRAVGIKVDATSIASGFASLPMSRVDVVSVLRRGDGDSVSRVLLENVLVLAADTETGRPPDRTAIPASVATVALTPDDAELVTLAAEMGTLRLLLRPTGDSNPSKTRGATSQVVFKGKGLKKNSSKYTEEAPEERAASLLRNIPDVKKEKPSAKTEEKSKPEEKSPAVRIEPKTRTHVLTIYNGDQGKRIPFKLDEHGQVVNEEITSFDLEPPAAPVKPAPKVEPKGEAKKPDEPKPAPVAPGPIKSPRRK